jgi:predicted amidohydrolase
VRVVSLNLNIEDLLPEENLYKLFCILKKIPEDTKLLLLPELWTTGYVQSEWESLSSKSDSIIEKLQNISRDREMAIGSSMIIKENEKLFNRFLLIQGGEIVAQYDKSHLFTPMREDKFLQGGKELVTFEFNGFKIAPTICYDLRFPEMYRKLALDGVNIFLVSAEWPKPRCETLMTLAKARAIENQAFLILSNRTGVDSSGVEFCGTSSVIYPDGRVDDVKSGADFIDAILDIADIQKAKKFIQPLEERIEGIDF